MTNSEKKKTAALAIRHIYPNLKFNENSITPEAAAFAFKVVVKVDKGARISAGLFAFNQVYTSWTKLPSAFVKAIWEELKKPDEKLKNAISSAFIAAQHRRNLEMHLSDPETFPCPDFRD